MVEDCADAQQQVDIYVLAPEDVVDVGAVAIKLAGEPVDRTFLSPEFGFDEFSDVYHGHKKCVDNFLLLIPALGSRMPTLEDKQSSRPTHI